MSKNKIQILRQNIGLDVSKEEFEANLVVLNEQLENRYMGRKVFNNTLKGIENFIEWANKKADPSVELEVTMEATGVYHENLAFSLYEQGWNIHVVLPNLVKKFIESHGIKSKTDKLDAKSLGQMGVERKLTRWQPASKNIKQLKALTRERSKRLKEQTKVKNQLHALKNSYNPPSSSIERYKELIKFLEDQIKAMEKEITHLIKKDEVLNAKMQKIISTPGLGITTVACIIAETNGFAGITSIKQLQSYAGYDIQIRESGKWKGKTKISKKGNSYIRHALYFPAYTITKYSSHHKVFYNRLCDNKEKSLIAATAVQRKLLGLIYTLWKKDTYFDPDYIQNKAA